MTLVQAYIIGLAMGIVASGVAFLAWYWLEDIKLRLDQSTAAWSRGFDQAWKIAYEKGLKHGEDFADSRWKDDLRKGIGVEIRHGKLIDARNIYSDDFTLSQESELRKAGL